MIGKDVGMIINLGSGKKMKVKTIISILLKFAKVGYQILDSLNLEKMKL